MVVKPVVSFGATGTPEAPIVCAPHTDCTVQRVPPPSTHVAVCFVRVVAPRAGVAARLLEPMVAASARTAAIFFVLMTTALGLGNVHTPSGFW